MALILRELIISRVIIDSELKWKEHIEYIYKKLINYSSIFHKLRNKLIITQFLFIQIYCMVLKIHVRPTLSH